MQEQTEVACRGHQELELLYGIDERVRLLQVLRKPPQLVFEHGLRIDQRHAEARRSHFLDSVSEEEADEEHRPGAELPRDRPGLGEESSQVRPPGPRGRQSAGDVQESPPQEQRPRSRWIRLAEEAPRESD